MADSFSSLVQFKSSLTRSSCCSSIIIKERFLSDFFVDTAFTSKCTPELVLLNSVNALANFEVEFLTEKDACLSSNLSILTFLE